MLKKIGKFLLKVLIVALIVAGVMAFFYGCSIWQMV